MISADILNGVGNLVFHLLVKFVDQNKDVHVIILLIFSGDSIKRKFIMRITFHSLFFRSPATIK
jgi:hypothetical protein